MQIELSSLDNCGVIEASAVLADAFSCFWMLTCYYDQFDGFLVNSLQQQFALLIDRDIQVNSAQVNEVLKSEVVSVLVYAEVGFLIDLEIGKPDSPEPLFRLVE